MKPLHFVRRAFAALLLMSGFAAPVGAEFDAGIDYEAVPIDGPRDGKTIEVLEFFYYGCPHCDSLEPRLAEWKRTLPEDVRFEAVPAPLNPRWTLYARAYYAAEALGVLKQGHRALFDALHRRNRSFGTKEALADFWAEHGADREQFLAQMNDFDLDRKVRRAAALTRRYGLSGVPTLVVDGRWATSPSQAGGNVRLLQVADHLIEQARNAR